MTTILDFSNNIENVENELEESKDSVESLELRNLNVKNFLDFSAIFLAKLFFKLDSLSLINCKIKNLNNQSIQNIPTLKSITLQNCNKNIFKILRSQSSLEKVTIINHDKTWNGFDHEGLNEILKNSKNLKHLVLDGIGTGSYLDGDDFPFKIEKLETTTITYHWYIGLKSKRTDFLESQKGSLKELTIHQLPFDFDGGEVLKYIIEEMGLEKFYFKNTALILDGQKQQVSEIEFTEIQITSLYEIFRQFPTIEKLTFNLNTTDISSDEIEKIINPPTKVFSSLKQVKVIDRSQNSGILGVYINLFKNFVNLVIFDIDSNDRNLKIILEECLPKMTKLKNVLLSSNALKASDNFLGMEKFRNFLNIEKISYYEDFKKM